MDLKNEVKKFTAIFPTVSETAMYEQAKTYVGLLVQFRVKLKKAKSQYIRRMKDQEKLPGKKSPVQQFGAIDVHDAA